MTWSTNSSGSAKRPWPFDTDGRIERGPASVPSLDCAVAQFGRNDADYATRTFHQDDVFSSQTVETANPSKWDPDTAVQSSHCTWNALQGSDSDKTDHDVAIHNNTAFTGQSAETLGQSNWNGQTIAQGLCSPEHSPATSEHTAATPNESTTIGNHSVCFGTVRRTFTLVISSV